MYGPCRTSELDGQTPYIMRISRSKKQKYSVITHEDRIISVLRTINFYDKP